MLTAFHEAGLGGVEICPIYGARGYEQRFIPYLAPRWMRMLDDTTRDAARLGLGVDLTTGTGWPMGGPWITRGEASESVFVAPDGAGGYALRFKQPVQRVKRAAPGGDGYVIDPFSIASLDAYLARFNQALLGYGGLLPRAQFQDSFEYFGADWTPDLPEQFRRRRGYDIRDHLAALAGAGDPDVGARVLEDYRRTLGELDREFIAHWTAWSHWHGSLTREQAHGSPANIEDVYATADIPETEGTFGGGTDAQIPMMAFASSAAHVRGRRLASSETFTWLGQHFQVPLGQLKPVVDRFYLAGINHIFLHGIPYSPADVPWPGWQFYAAVNFGPEGGLWHDLPAFFAYATRCQSILQAGRPDNDVLLYFPVADYWQKPLKRGSGRDPLLVPLTTPGKWMWGTPFHTAAMELWRQGYGFDEVTDDLLAAAGADDGRVVLGGNRYRAIVVPPCRFLPVTTLERLIALARDGATVVFEAPPPTDVPGFHDFEARRAKLQGLLDGLHLAATGRTAVGRGWFAIGGNAELAAAGVRREAMADLGLHAVRRARESGTDYFIVNDGDRVVDGWVPVSQPGAFAVILDPLAGDRIGRAALRDGGANLYLQLPPQGSLVVRVYDSVPPGADRVPAWVYVRPAGTAPLPLDGSWSVTFLSGGPVLPQTFTSTGPVPWTERHEPEVDRFAGTARYETTFSVDPSAAPEWTLSLGKVADSADVFLNGRRVSALWCAPFRVAVGRYLKPGRNVLDVEVTNIGANRVRDLDRRHVDWKGYVGDIGLVNPDYTPFNAADWPVRVSGLIGPVSLQPTETFQPSL